jgi:hypothetical protein
VSTVATFRGMAAARGRRTLVEIKAVDALYPLFGAVKLAARLDLHDALAKRGNRFGAVADPVLLDKLGIAPSDVIKLGNAEFELSTALVSEPDRVGDGFALGPRLMISREALAATGLVQPGSLVTWRNRLKFDRGGSEEVRQVIKEAKRQFPDAGWRLRGRDNAAPQVGRFVERVSFFLSLAGLTALITGGVGVMNTVRAFLNRRMANIAMLKCLGAPSRLVFLTYFIEVLAVALVAIIIGLVPGAVAPAVVNALLASVLPLPIATGIEWGALALAAAYGFAAAVGFAVGRSSSRWTCGRSRSCAAMPGSHHRAGGPGSSPSSRWRRWRSLPWRSTACRTLPSPPGSSAARLVLPCAVRAGAAHDDGSGAAAGTGQRGQGLCAGIALPAGQCHALRSAGARPRTDAVRDAGACRPLAQQRIALEPAGERAFVLFPRCANSEHDRFVTLLRDTSGSDRIGDAPMLRARSRR